MKICILSMQMVDNYGSVLQAYALKRIIENCGHQVEFIDILPNFNEDELLKDSRQIFEEDIENYHKMGILRQIKKIDKYIVYRIQNKFNVFKQQEMYKEFRKKFLNIEEKNKNTHYDVCIIGSDEVFNCLCDSPWGFTSQLFGNVSQAERVITYAASCGATKVEKLPNAVVNKIQHSLDNMSTISVRDENTRVFVQKIAGEKKDIIQHLDPALLYNFSENIEIDNGLLKKLGRYCIVYSYNNRIHDSDEIMEIKKICSEKQMNIITLGSPQMWTNNFLPVTPFVLLGLFAKAEFIITDTFHGTIFSAKLAKKFAVMVRPSNENKLNDLLKRLKIEHHKVNNFCELSNVYEIENDIKKIDDILSKEMEKSVSYIQEMLRDDAGNKLIQS